MLIKKFKIENDNMTDQDVIEIKHECENWGKIWPNRLAIKHHTKRTLANICNS